MADRDEDDGLFSNRVKVWWGNLVPAAGRFAVNAGCVDIDGVLWPHSVCERGAIVPEDRT